MAVGLSHKSLLLGVPQPPAQSGYGSSRLCAVMRPAWRAGNNKQTTEEMGNELGKIGTVFSDEAVKCL